MSVRAAALTLAFASACSHAPPPKGDAGHGVDPERTARVLTCKAACEKTLATASNGEAAWGGECKTLCRYPDTQTCVHEWCEAECAIANAKGIGPAIGHWCSTGGDGWRICRQACSRVPACQQQWCGDDKPSRARELTVLRADHAACMATCDTLK